MMFRPEFPNPQFRRDNWVNLNGTWSFCMDKEDNGVEKKYFEKTDFEKNHLSFELVVDGEVISSESAIFAQHKYYEFKNPALKVRREGDEIVVTSEAYARYVEIYSEEEDFLLSDNFFDMEKGEVRVKILRGDPKNLLVRSVYDVR